ncbi:zinc metalloproteinase nas-1-like isoform X2 [Gigantopelta aegis]|uniref:zinc metalloproteinase nas-1-like isoform X2 n=1 Tax=Gigantopelta aegis TaxID=1735272 RepID=UPI001B88849D|nr:zinc metalloproteinase nas-1-like isoform X2 [Gigantopelta aegis]
MGHRIATAFIVTVSLVLCLSVPGNQNGRYSVSGHVSSMDVEREKRQDGNSHDRSGKRGVIYKFARKWPNKVIPFEISPSVFSAREVRAIYESMDNWERITCVRFRQATDEDRHRIKFTAGGKTCRSSIGMSRARQQGIFLKPDCRRTPLITHELGHVLGFRHEHNRPDRDEYIRIAFENMKLANGFKRYFRKLSSHFSKTYGTPYDYKSIMHYHAQTYGRPGHDVIITKDSAFHEQIGYFNAKTPSFLDAKVANRRYQCSELCPNRHETCPGEGFVGPDCKCWCPGDLDSVHVRYCDGGDLPRPWHSANSECVDSHALCCIMLGRDLCVSAAFRNKCQRTCRVC